MAEESEQSPEQAADPYTYMGSLLDSVYARHSRYGGFGFDPPHSDSALGRDDSSHVAGGRLVSYGVANLLTSATDKALGLKILVQYPTGVPVMSLWALTRGLLESSASALWIMAGTNRDARLARAMRVHHHDLDELTKWSSEAGVGTPVLEEMASLRAAVERAGLDARHVFQKFNYGEAVASAGQLVGMEYRQAYALWRATAAFAHGRTWPAMYLTSHPLTVYRGSGEFSMAAELSIEHHRPAWELAERIFERAAREFDSRSQKSDR